MCTVLKITAYNDSLLVRCNLSQASSPIEVRYEKSGEWESTQYQCGETRHTSQGLAEIGASLMADAIGEVKEDMEWDWSDCFESSPNLEHVTAEEWYDAYGWNLSTEHAGDVILQAVEYDWLDESDESVLEKLMAEHENLTDDEALEIVAKARSIRQDAEEIEARLIEAVKAYHAGEPDECLAALDRAKAVSVPHGDDESRSLRSKLLPTN